MMAAGLQAYNPQLWAAEAVQLLWENLVYAGLVHRDFENEVASYGQTVNTRMPAALEAQRKNNDLDEIEEQGPTAENIQVKLDQRVYVSFMLGDGAQSLSFQELTNIYLMDAMRANAQFLDRVIAAQAYQFLNYTAGGLQQMTKANAHDYLLDARKVFNDNNVPLDMRMLGLASNSETLMQKNDLFKQAYSIGDSGEALRNALLGRLDGWNTFMSQNTPSVQATDVTTVGSQVNGAHSKGVNVLAVDSGSDFEEGQYIVINGDYNPNRVISISGNNLTLARPLANAVLNNAPIVVVHFCSVDQSGAIAKGDIYAAVASGYPQYWPGKIRVLLSSGSDNVPQLFQLVAFGDALHEYGIVKVTQVSSTAYDILVDRPLEAAIADNANIYLGPAGDYNFGFQRNAVALVNRPLATSNDDGVRMAIARAHNMSMRVEISRDSKKQGRRVTVDALFGVKPLDVKRGMVLLG